MVPLYATTKPVYGKTGSVPQKIHTNGCSLCRSHSSNGSYSSSRNGFCSSNGSVLCARAAVPGSLRRSVPSRTAFVLLCARASAFAVGARTHHAHDSQATVAEVSQATVTRASQATVTGDSQATVADVAADDLQATAAADSQATMCVRRRCRGLTGDFGRALAGESGRCRRQGRSGLARDHGGRISTLFLDTKTVAQPEPFIEGLEPHPAVDVLDTCCRATLTVTCVPRPDLTTSGTHPAQLGVRGRCYRLWCTRSFGWFAQFARFSECTQSRAWREGS